MLKQSRIVPYIPVADVARARKFYEDTIGLTPRETYAGGVIYECGSGSWVFMYPSAGAGTSGVGGIQTRVLKGDPTKPGLYTIQLTVPANTKIEAHTHPDDRVSTVISGTWQIGYGTALDEKKLKPLVPGSFYTEPPALAHFARTGNTAVIVQITGYGPTGTTYVGRGQQK